MLAADRSDFSSNSSFSVGPVQHGGCDLRAGVQTVHASGVPKGGRLAASLLAAVQVGPFSRISDSIF